MGLPKVKIDLKMMLSAAGPRAVVLVSAVNGLASQHKRKSAALTLAGVLNISSAENECVVHLGSKLAALGSCLSLVSSASCARCCLVQP